ncbi:MAG: L-fucose/L-arabinose isomerase family protein [Chitinophagales bacterium]
MDFERRTALGRIKLGYAPTRRDVFSREAARAQAGLVADRLRQWQVDFVDLSWLNEEGLLHSAADVPRVVRRFREEGVDAVFSPHCNFGTEEAVAKLAAALGKPFLLWGPRDDAPLPGGLRQRDTQCGLFATSKVLRRLGVPFTYIVNSRLDDPVFARGVRTFLAAAAVVKAFRRLRIGQISTRPASFWTMMVSEGELLERFGVEVVPLTLVDVVRRVDALVAAGGEALRSTLADFRARVQFPGIAEEAVARLAALKLVLKEWAEGEGLSAIAFQCWSALQDALGIIPCFVNAELTDEGLPTICETDIHGAISAVMAQAARMGESPVFFADLTVRHPENDDAELLWHCGPFPYSLKADGYPAVVGRHYIQPGEPPGVAEWEIRGGDVTVVRFDGDHGEYSLLFGQARGTAGPRTRGTYLWVEVGDWPAWEERFIRGPYVHHVAGVHGQVAPALYEACRYLPGLTPDPVDPTEEELKAWFRRVR